MDKLTLVILIICGNSVFNSVQRSALCPTGVFSSKKKDTNSTGCMISNAINSVTSLLCCGSLIYILFIQTTNNRSYNGFRKKI